MQVGIARWWGLLGLVWGVLGVVALPSAEAQLQQNRDAVAVRAVWGHPSAQSGDGRVLAVVLEVGDGWHVNANPDQVIEAGFTIIPTTIDVQDAAGLKIGEPIWPDAHKIEVGYVDGQIAVFEGQTVVYLPVIVPEGAAAEGTLTPVVSVRYQTCDDEVCLPPTRVSLKPELTLAATEPGAELPAADAELFAAFDPTALDRLRAAEPSPGEGEAASDAATGDGLVATTPAPARGFVGLAVLAGLAFLGGLVLNMTPCVLPVIPIKVMTLGQHGGARGRTLYLGIWMALGVVAFWVAAGLPVVLFAGATDPSQIFGYWWLTLGIGVLIAAMGVGIMGVFTINLPQAAYKVNPKADTAGGSFVFGVMTAVLGLPCFGFVAGALLAGAATMPALDIMVIFTALGVGMASPYLVLSAFPQWLDALPRTGPASELVKQVMGLLLLAAAAYFAGAGLIALVADHPYLARQLHWWVVAGFALLAGVWLAVRTWQITSSSAKRGVFSVVAIVLAGVAVWYAANSTLDARHKYLEKQAAIAAAGGSEAAIITSTWMDYEPGLIERAKDAGYVVVLDFTAEWCLNCKALKAAVLNVEPVESRLAEEDVVSITVDLTSRHAPGWALLAEYEQTGIPLLVVESPNGGAPWLSNRYTGSQVLAAIEAAGGVEEAGGSTAAIR